MSFKIAVGSSYGKIIDQHFGSGDRFYVYEVFEDGSFNIIEIRENRSSNYADKPSSCNDYEHNGCSSNCNPNVHDESGLLEKIYLLSDCHAVLIYQIGRGAEKLLLSKGIQAFEAKGTIENALSKLYLYYKRTKQIQ